ncbi:hypothetical protein PAXINDRAFT_75095 [Paxillus involutus ATCC 200175]|nr:hypothetical protein PAXINDRAFT_75095 [Paxillus involutus ATCC 200175]
MTDDSKLLTPIILRVDCVACSDTFEDLACLHAPCSHFFCRQCVTNMAEVANRDEGLLPLQCCQKQLPLNVVLSFLPGTLRTSFSAKCAESSTPPPMRIYCPNKRCSTFIGRALGQATPSEVLCPECNTAVCSGCGTLAHLPEDCKENELTREVRKLATAKGWKTCPGCKAIVELRDGCWHMVCRCSTHFCYGCAAKWKTCKC